MKTAAGLIKKYYSWLKDETALKDINGWTEITSPYLDRNNDYIQIYLKKTEGGWLLTDDGETVSGLNQEGCGLDSPRRRELLQFILKGYGVAEKEGSLQVTAASPDDFPVCKHSLIQAILSVNDMFYTASPQITALFFEDVRDWLEKAEIRYSERVSFTGSSGYIRAFDFIIPKSSQQAERLIKTINRPDKSSSDSLVMSWLDTIDSRPSGSKIYAFMNDTDTNGSAFSGVPDSGSSISKTAAAFKHYKIRPVLWSQKDKAKEELAS